MWIHWILVGIQDLDGHRGLAWVHYKQFWEQTVGWFWRHLLDKAQTDRHGDFSHSFTQMKSNALCRSCPRYPPRSAHTTFQRKITYINLNDFTPSAKGQQLADLTLVLSSSRCSRIIPLDTLPTRVSHGDFVRGFRLWSCWTGGQHRQVFARSGLYRNSHCLTFTDRPP